MVYTCCVPECNTGYKSCKTSEKVAVFKFPTDINLKQQWIRAIPRKDWVPTNSHRVCSKHFSSDDFISTSNDHRYDRKASRPSNNLLRLRLKPSVVPHIFPSLPKYLSNEVVKPRSTILASSSSRRDLENAAILEKNENLLESEMFKDFEEFKEKLSCESLPSGYISEIGQNFVLFHYIKYSEQIGNAPELLASVIVKDTLEINAFVHSAALSKSIYKHLLSSDILKSTSELSNLLALCKSLCEDGSTGNVACIPLAISLLDRYVGAEDASENEDNLPLIKFVIEQLKLSLVKKNGRRYSSQTLTTAFLWQLTSSCLYKKLRQLLILPSISLLRKLSADLNVEGGMLDLRYLKQRSSDLTEMEKLVVLIVDEVYTAQRVEYSNGSFIGLTEHGAPAKTVLTFMVQSICGKYKDVICLIPVDKLDSTLLKTWFYKVMGFLDNIFTVVAVSADNHVCNRKLFTDLCGGSLEHSIVHPTKKDERLFLFFDFTHNVKNIYNHFVNKQRMNPPCTGHEHLLGETCHANFVHIKQLYALEEDKALKVAHKLKKVALNPSSIARTSPQHALGVFSESTSLGLKHYASTYNAFPDTARYIDFISNIWKIMSVKAPYKDCRKRDDMYMPMRREDGHPGLAYLQEALQIFKEWKASGRAGLTTETFTACIQSMGALPDLAYYLQQKHNVAYLLSGKLMSDPLEGRFGWYRQVSGGNFFISVKQVLLAEKKIRCLSLLQQEALLSATAIKPSDVDKDFEGSTEADSAHIWLSDFLLPITLDDISQTDGAVAYFVAGYIARSIARRRKCSACKEILVVSNDTPSLQDCVPDEYKSIFEMANRGGLCTPSELCFSITALAAQYYTFIAADETKLQKLLAQPNQRSVFVKATSIAASASTTLQCLVNVQCSSNHQNFVLIVQTAYNCFAKNCLKRMNSRPIADPPAKALRKVRKLTSKASDQH